MKAITSRLPGVQSNLARSMVAATLLLMLFALSVGSASAGVTSFSGKVPRIGSVTFRQDYMSGRGEYPPYYEIRVRMTKNPYDLYVKAVTCDGRNISTGPRFIPANSSKLITVATNVPPQCFRLNFDAPTLEQFEIAGRVSY